MCFFQLLSHLLTRQLVLYEFFWCFQHGLDQPVAWLDFLIFSNAKKIIKLRQRCATCTWRSRHQSRTTSSGNLLIFFKTTKTFQNNSKIIKILAKTIFKIKKPSMFAHTVEQSMWLGEGKEWVSLQLSLSQPSYLFFWKVSKRFEKTFEAFWRGKSENFCFWKRKQMQF